MTCKDGVARGHVGETNRDCNEKQRLRSLLLQRSLLLSLLLLQRLRSLLLQRSLLLSLLLLLMTAHLLPTLLAALSFRHEALKQTPPPAMKSNACAASSSSS